MVTAAVVASGAATSRGAAAASLRARDGRIIPLHWHRWFGTPLPEEEAVLSRVRAPVLDVGCGPGRHALALTRRGVTALGVDTAASAAAIAASRGVAVLVRSVFEPIPGVGTWGTALLMDGNIGIGGDPRALLRRVRQLIRWDGCALVEVGPPGAPTDSLWVQGEVGGSPVGGWFPWAEVGADGLAEIAERSGFRVGELWTQEERWFARLDACAGGGQ
jgi:SAM-dependent methyltransferase